METIESQTTAGLSSTIIHYVPVGKSHDRLGTGGEGQLPENGGNRPPEMVSVHSYSQLCGRGSNKCGAAVGVPYHWLCGARRKKCHGRRRGILELAGRSLYYASSLNTSQ